MSSPDPTGPFALAIPRERYEALVREEIAAALPMEDARRIRRELLLLVASISSDEGGLLLRITPRYFREICEANGVAAVTLGYKTPRYRIAAVSAALDRLSVAAGRDAAELRARFVEITAGLVREIEALAA